ncbi:hypothetical protein [Paenibacillus luteus]|uniref:hypothetical protein n=1 Tax=Paenibacillus luteus TaxID=2545753 RepID=UPI00137616D0|nr:hypothetical protein [Paenibacillus luteus]
MKKTNKVVSLTLLSALFISALSGCGSANHAPEASNNTASPTAEVSDNPYKDHMDISIS